MKRAISVFLAVFVLLAFAGAAIAKEMSGEVTAVNVEKGTLTLKSGKVEGGFDCEKGSLLKDIKVGDQVTVQYKEEGGKKIITSITPKQKKPAAGY